MKKNDYDPNFKPEKVFFIVGGKVVVSNPEGKILILLRSEKTSLGKEWSLPGGALEKNETAYEGIIREMKEETSLKIKETEVFSVATFNHGGKDPTIVIGYTAKVGNGNLKLNWEHDDYKWLAVPDALKYKLTSGARFFLEKYLTLNKRKLYKIS